MPRRLGATHDNHIRPCSTGGVMSAGTDVGLRRRPRRIARKGAHRWADAARQLPFRSRGHPALTGLIAAAQGSEHQSLAAHAGHRRALRQSSPASHAHVLADIANGLPPLAAPLIAARAPLAVPVHSGDRWTVYRTVEF